MIRSVDRHVVTRESEKYGVAKSMNFVLSRLGFRTYAACSWVLLNPRPEDIDQAIPSN
jgi:hypothetical protein